MSLTIANSEHPAAGTNHSTGSQQSLVQLLLPSLQPATSDWSITDWHPAFTASTAHTDPNGWASPGTICMAILQGKQHLAPLYILDVIKQGDPSEHKLLALNLSLHPHLTGPALCYLPLGQDIDAGKPFKANLGALEQAATAPAPAFAPPGGHKSVSMYKLCPLPPAWLAKLTAADTPVAALYQLAKDSLDRAQATHKELLQWLHQAATGEGSSSSLSLQPTEVDPLALHQSQPSVWSNCHQQLNSLSPAIAQAWSSWTSPSVTQPSPLEGPVGPTPGQPSPPGTGGPTIEPVGPGTGQPPGTGAHQQPITVGPGTGQPPGTGAHQQPVTGNTPVTGTHTSPGTGASTQPTTGTHQPLPPYPGPSPGMHSWPPYGYPGFFPWGPSPPPGHFNAPFPTGYDQTTPFNQITYSATSRGLERHQEAALRGWAGLSPQDPLPAFWSQYNMHSTKAAKQNAVETVIWPALREAHPSFKSQTLLHDDLRDVIALFKFKPDPHPSEKSYMGLGPLMFAPQSTLALDQMRQESDTRDRVTMVTSRDIKLRKAPPAPGTTLEVSALLHRMKSCYLEVFGPLCPAIPSLTALLAAIDTAHGELLARPGGETTFATSMAPHVLQGVHRCCFDFFSTMAPAHSDGTHTGPTFDLSHVINQVRTLSHFQSLHQPAAVFYSPATQHTPLPQQAPLQHRHQPQSYNHQGDQLATLRPPCTNPAYPHSCTQALQRWTQANRPPHEQSRGVPVAVIAQACGWRTEDVNPKLSQPQNACKRYLLTGECSFAGCQFFHPRNPPALSPHVIRAIERTLPTLPFNRRGSPRAPPGTNPQPPQDPRPAPGTAPSPGTTQAPAPAPAPGRG